MSANDSNPPAASVESLTRDLANARREENYLKATVHELEQKAGWQEHRLVDMRVSLEDAHGRLSASHTENTRLQAALARAEAQSEEMRRDLRKALGDFEEAQRLAWEMHDDNRRRQTALAQAQAALVAQAAEANRVSLLEQNAYNVLRLANDGQRQRMAKLEAESDALRRERDQLAGSLDKLR
eukprot:2886018-Rhodomonas_salina.1